MTIIKEQFAFEIIHKFVLIERFSKPEAMSESRFSKLKRFGAANPVTAKETLRW